jgi:YHS domain-containing protein
LEEPLGRSIDQKRKQTAAIQVFGKKPAKHVSAPSRIQNTKIPNGRMLMTKDPVCKMDVDESKTNFKSEYAGRNYHFCSEECKDTFDSQPERYAATAA